MTDDQKPSIREQYTQAVQAKRLVLSEHRSGDVELLVAGGWVREGLATLLYRLQGEYDVARGDQRRAMLEQERILMLREEAMREWRGQVKLESAWMAKHHGPPRSPLLRARADALAKQAADVAVQARAFALIGLKSLNKTKQALGTHALSMAPRMGLKMEDMEAAKVALTQALLAKQAGTATRAEVVAARARMAAAVADERRIFQLAGKVLDVLLDPLCPMCFGRGTMGELGKVKMYLCPDRKHGGCGGTGKRPVDFGVNLEETRFAQWLLADLDRRCARVDQLIRKFVRQAGKPRALGQEQVDVETQALRRRLADLRSTAAEAD